MKQRKLLVLELVASTTSSSVLHAALVVSMIPPRPPDTGHSKVVSAVLESVDSKAMLPPDVVT